MSESRREVYGRQVRVGRKLLFILGTLIALDQVASIVLTALGPWTAFRLLCGVVVPLVAIYGLVLLWRGNDLLRWYIGVWCVANGAMNVLAFAYIGYRLFRETPPESFGFLSSVLVAAFGVPIIISAVSICAGFMVIWSRNLSMFVAYRAVVTGRLQLVAGDDLVAGASGVDSTSQPSDANRRESAFGGEDVSAGRE
jgi:hypothetical protein